MLPGRLAAVAQQEDGILQQVTLSPGYTKFFKATNIETLRGMRLVLAALSFRPGTYTCTCMYGVCFISVAGLGKTYLESESISRVVVNYRLIRYLDSKVGKVMVKLVEHVNVGNVK